MIVTRKLGRMGRIGIWLLTWLLLLSIQGMAFGSPLAATRRSAAIPQTAIDNFPRIGMESFEGSQAAMQDIAGSGAKYVRLELLWYQIEPVNTTPDHYNWFIYDPLLSYVAAAGMTPLVAIGGCPDWACPRDIGPLNDGMYGEAAQFMGAMAAHYSADPYRAHFWEMWNEPDGTAGPTPGDRSWGWGAHPDKYALMLRNIYPAIKAADPGSVVLSGGVAYSYFWDQGGPFNRDFLPQVIADGGAPYIDAIGYHYYTNDTGYTNVGSKADVIRAAIGPPAQNMPFICTEAGLTSDPRFGSSETIQARYIVKLPTWAAAYNVRSVTWYLHQDYDTPDPEHDIFAQAGVVRRDNSHKQSYGSLLVYSEEVGSAPFLRALGAPDGLPSGLEGYMFTRAPGIDPNLHVWVVWSRSDATGTLTIPGDMAPTVVRALDIYGNPIAITHGNGTLLINVGADPVYVETNSNPLRFSDVPYMYWAYSYVDYLASNGIVAGYADGTFRPGAPATRGQFAKMDTLGIGWPLLNPPNPTFADVAPGSTFYQYVETASARGVINGYLCGGMAEPCDNQNRPYFRTNNNVTRAQIAKIIVGSKGWTLLNPDQSTFTDIPYGSTFYQYIETAVAKGILAGYACGGPGEPCDDMTHPYFRPGNNATRAQLSKMLALALQQP